MIRVVNAARGEVSATLAGTPVRLCLTLGALVEIETALDVEDIEALSVRTARLTAADLQNVLVALLRGGGAEDPERLAAQADPQTAARAVAAAFKAAAQ